MTEPVSVPLARTPVWETNQNGDPVFTRPWFLFFQALFARSGGSITPDTPDAIASVLDEVRQLPGAAEIVFPEPLMLESVGLRDRVAVLGSQIDEINQGPSL